MSAESAIQEVPVPQNALSPQEIEHLQQVIARLDARGAPDDADRRIHPRIDFAQPMWLNLPGQACPWVEVLSRNLSTNGLGFLTRRLFYAGQQLVIAHQLTECTPMLVLCRVCYCRPIDLGVLEVGLAFVSARPDPKRLRQIPGEWLVHMLEHDYLTRRRLAAV